MPIKWTAEADVALLLAMLEVANVKTSTKGFWKQVIDKTGEGTDRSFEQHYATLKKRRDACAAQGGSLLSATISVSNTPSAPRAQTPRKRKAATTEDSPTKKKAKTVKKHIEGNEGENENDICNDDDESGGDIKPKIEAKEDDPF